MKHYETERRFLINLSNLPYNLTEFSKKEITQVYISKDSRIREMEGKYYITTKEDVPGSYLTQIEDENEITKEEYDKLLKKQIGNTVFKDRYYILYGKYTLELNLYKKDLNGLCMLEVEFPSEDEALDFNPPDWVVKEVSYDPAYRNSSLAINGLPREFARKHSSVRSLIHHPDKSNGYER